MKNFTKKDFLIFACLAFVFYKLNGIKFNVSGKPAVNPDCGCNG